MASIAPFPVTVHPFPSPTPFSCAYEQGSSSSRNALVYIGGLTSGPHTTEVVQFIFSAIKDAGLSYGLWEFRMRSSYSGFGYSSIANDVEDISALVTYLRSLGKEEVVLMGSSTGCQDAMAYITSKIGNNSRPPVDGCILQAPTSDRETGEMLMPPDFFAQTLIHASDMIKQGKQDEAMPKALIPPIFSSPVTAYRWHSLIAKGGDDDYFSSDLDDTRLAETFGRLDIPTLMVPSENDEMVPPRVDKQDLLQRWMKASPAGVVSELSGLNPKADHTLGDPEARTWFTKRVLKFLNEMEDR